MTRLTGQASRVLRRDASRGHLSGDAGINEQSHYVLLEHLVKDETLPHGYPYRTLPYLGKRMQSGEGLFQFDTFEQAKGFVEEQIHTWEDTQQEQPRPPRRPPIPQECSGQRVCSVSPLPR